jgi:LTXXQ motif family protein
MSKSGIGIVIIVLAALVSSVALGRGGGGGHGGGHGGGGHHGGGHGGGHFGGHFGGGHFGGHRGGARFAFSHGGFHGHSFGHHGGVNSLSHTGGWRNGRLLSHPAARGQIVAAAALAGWHGGHFANGWWRHGDGFYGWVGPLFWPFAYYDIYDYTIWRDYGFWYYGYPDIYAGLFGPYGYDDLIGYLPQARDPRQARASLLARMCGDDSRDIAGLPIDQIEQAIQPNEAQRAALDDLGNASVRAAQSIRAACPTQVVLTAPGRLAAMQHRIEAMISAVAIVRSPLEWVYSLLDDEQKARFNALAEDERRSAAANNPKRSLGESCGAGQSATFEWPTSEIEDRLHPNDTQRAALKALQNASSKAAEMLKAACQPDDPATPPARLAAIGRRLDTMLEAVKLVRAALGDFYATLSDEQKAQFEAIGQKRMVRGA